MIPIGTICFIVRTEPGNEHVLGRVVTVVSVMQRRPERDNHWFHQIDAAWIRAEHPGVQAFAAPSALRPIAGPARSLPAPRRRRPVHA